MRRTHISLPSLEGDMLKRRAGARTPQLSPKVTAATLTIGQPMEL